MLRMLMVSPPVVVAVPSSPILDGRGRARPDARPDDARGARAAMLCESPRRGCNMAVMPDRLAAGRARRARDPEKWEPVFGKDHAQKSWSGMIIIPLRRGAP